MDAVFKVYDSKGAARIWHIMRSDVGDLWCRTYFYESAGAAEASHKVLQRLNGTLDDEQREDILRDALLHAQVRDDGQPLRTWRHVEVAFLDGETPRDGVLAARLRDFQLECVADGTIDDEA